MCRHQCSGGSVIQHILLSKNLSSKKLTMKTFLAFSIFCLMATFTTVARGDRRNIIMFLIDDQNPSSIAAFGGGRNEVHSSLRQQFGLYTISVQLSDRSVRC